MDIEDKHTHGLRITSDKIKINLTIGICKQIAEEMFDRKKNELFYNEVNYCGISLI